MEDEIVLITKKRLIDLLTSSEELSRLSLGGVDNWEWYGEALSGEQDGLPPFDEAEEAIFNQVNETPNGALFEG